jgi:hypothetical protein
MWTSQSVTAHLTDYFRPFPGAPIPAWLPVVKWQLQLVRHARAKADHRSIRGMCPEWGLSKSAHYRRVKGAGNTMAESMNLEEATR